MARTTWRTCRWGAQLRPPCVRLASQVPLFASYACPAPTILCRQAIYPLGSRPYRGGQGTEWEFCGALKAGVTACAGRAAFSGRQWSHGTAGTGGSVRTPSFSVPHFVSPFASFSARLALMQFGVASVCLPGLDLHSASFAVRSVSCATYQSTVLTSSCGSRVSQPASAEINSALRRNNQ